MVELLEKIQPEFDKALNVIDEKIFIGQELRTMIQHYLSGLDYELNKFSESKDSDNFVNHLASIYNSSSQATPLSKNTKSLSKSLKSDEKGDRISKKMKITK